MPHEEMRDPGVQVRPSCGRIERQSLLAVDEKGLEAELPELARHHLGNHDIAALDRPLEDHPRMPLRCHGPPGGAGRLGQPNRSAHLGLSIDSLQVSWQIVQSVGCGLQVDAGSPSFRLSCSR